MARTDLFFSYRVEKKLFGKTGRLMSVIGRSDCKLIDYRTLAVIVTSLLFGG